MVLAAGRGTRMGRQKQTLPIDGKPMLARVLETLSKSEVDKVIVVLGARAAEVRRKVKFEKETVIVNRAFGGGIAGSLKAGLASVGPSADAALIVLGDQPFLSPLTVDRMIAAYRNSRASLVVPVYHSVRGNPVLFDRSLFPEVMSISGDTGARRVVKRHEDQMLQVEVADEGVTLDIDTPSDFRNATAGLGKRVRP